MSNHPPPSQQVDVPPDLQQIPILVVDDLEDNRVLLEELLAEEGYREVIPVASGIDALALLEQRSDIGLILLDLHMPVLDGYETCRRIVANEKTAHIPVIVVTGAALRRDEALVKSFACGAMDYIAKPVNEIELYGRIRSALLLYRERIQNRLKTQALFESQQRYELAINGVNDGIWDLNLATNQAYFSPKWKEILGYREDELPNKPEVWDDLVHPDDRERVRTAMRDHWNRVTPYYTIEYRLRSKSGEYKHVFCRGRAVWDEQGNVIRMAGSTTDITAHKELEKQLRQAQQMEITGRLESIGRLAAGVAHDFNNLLTAILGHATIGRGLIAPDSPAQDSLLKIQSAAQQAADFCKQLLTYSGQSRAQVETVDLNSIARETAELVKVVINRKIRIELGLVAEACHVNADSAQIRQVILNLLINAAEAIGDRDGGIIRLATRVVDSGDIQPDATDPTGPVPEGRFIRLDLSDTGSGIAPEDLKRIFEPFFTTKSTGRGLGLAAAKGIVKTNNGIMRVASRLGEGTTFTIYLPQATPPRAAVSSAREDLSGWKGSGTVLVIEDEPFVREVAGMLLRELQFGVLLAEDGRRGVEEFQKHQREIVAVISDLNMPDMSGDEAIRQIRQIRPEVPVLLSSGYSEEHVARIFPGDGVTAFIQKPYLAQQIASKLRACLQ